MSPPRLVDRSSSPCRLRKRRRKAWSSRRPSSFRLSVRCVSRLGRRWSIVFRFRFRSKLKVGGRRKEDDEGVLRERMMMMLSKASILDGGVVVSLAFFAGKGVEAKSLFLLSSSLKSSLSNVNDVPKNVTRGRSASVARVSTARRVSLASSKTRERRRQIFVALVHRTRGKRTTTLEETKRQRLRSFVNGKFFFSSSKQQKLTDFSSSSSSSSQNDDVLELQSS